MRSYVEASGFPLVGVGGIPVPRVIIGCLPFLGESYQGEAKNRLYVERFSNVDYTVKVLVKAVEDYGATAVSAVPSMEGRLASLLLEAIKRTERITDVELALTFCLRIPLRMEGERIDDYRRWASYLNYEAKLAGENVLERYLNDPILLCRKGWKKRFRYTVDHLGGYDRDELDKLEIDFDRVKDCLDCFRDFKVIFVEPGSESDFLAISGRLDLLEDLVSLLRNEGFETIVLGVHHAGSTIPILEDSEIEVDGYLTPVNKLGALMLPNRELALKAIKGSSKPVIAIKTMAGGRIPPAEALDFVFNEVGVDACMIGVGSLEELEEDFSIAKRILKGLDEESS